MKLTAVRLAVIAVYVIVLYVVFAALMSTAKSHEHHSAADGGPLYDDACCNNQDCSPVSVEDVEEIENGDWRYIPEGQVFKKSEGRVRPSRNSKFHVCISPNARMPYCIYILQGT